MIRTGTVRPWFAGPSGSELRLVIADRSVPVLSLSRDGIAIRTDPSLKLRGLVHLYDGTRHIATGLACSDVVEGDLHRLHFKRITPAFDAPPRDFAEGGDLPVALLPGPDAMRAGL